MKRPHTALSRRELIKSFGIGALLLQPVLRSMAYAAETPYEKAPRYIMFFKGGAYYPSRTSPSSLTKLDGTPIKPLEPHASDIILFKGMNIHSGSPKTNGYKEEHADGLFGCVTGHQYKYFQNDAYFAYTDNQSIDVAIAEHYKTRPDLKDIPLKSLHIGGGAHSDADKVGVGNRYVSFRNRQPGDSRYGNAIEPMQDAGQVYDTLMRAAAGMCAAHSNQPRGDAEKLASSTASSTRDIDFLHRHLKDAKLAIGLDIEHTRKLDGSFDHFAQTVALVRRAADAEKAGTRKAAGSKGCATMARPSGNGANMKNLDQLSPVHDQMIALIKLAFELDLTRVVSFTLSGASSGQVWPSRGIHKAHHELEHSGNVDALVKIDTYYSEKFAGLLTALKSIDDGGGKTALYNSMAFLGMECWSNSSSNHYMKDVPFIFAGQGGGRFKTGDIVRANGRNNNDIHISCLQAAGMKTDVFGLQSLCQGPIIPTGKVGA